MEDKPDDLDAPDSKPKSDVPITQRSEQDLQTIDLGPDDLREAYRTSLARVGQIRGLIPLNRAAARPNPTVVPAPTPPPPIAAVGPQIVSAPSPTGLLISTEVDIYLNAIWSEALTANVNLAEYFSLPPLSEVKDMLNKFRNPKDKKNFCLRAIFELLSLMQVYQRNRYSPSISANSLGKLIIRIQSARIISDKNPIASIALEKIISDIIAEPGLYDSNVDIAWYSFLTT